MVKKKTKKKDVGAGIRRLISAGLPQQATEGFGDKEMLKQLKMQKQILAERKRIQKAKREFMKQQQLQMAELEAQKTDPRFQHDMSDEQFLESDDPRHSARMNRIEEAQIMREQQRQMSGNMLTPIKHRLNNSRFLASILSRRGEVRGNTILSQKNEMMPVSEMQTQSIEFSGRNNPRGMISLMGSQNHNNNLMGTETQNHFLHDERQGQTILGKDNSEIVQPNLQKHQREVRKIKWF